MKFKKRLRRDTIIISLRKDRPDYTLKMIGDTVDLSRERIRQILQSEGFQTKSTKYGKPKIVAIREKHRAIDLPTTQDINSPNDEIAKLKIQIRRQRNIIETQGNCRICGKYDVLGNGLCKDCYDETLGY